MNVLMSYNPFQKTPLNDGLTLEFYVAFWSDLETPSRLHQLLLIMSLENFHCSPKQAINTLIEKQGKDKREIKNWWPTCILLINVDAKIISKVLEKRLEKVLPNVIQPSLNAFVKGRSIFDPIREDCNV